MVAMPIEIDSGDSLGGISDAQQWNVRSPSSSYAHERNYGADRVKSFHKSFFQRRIAEKRGCPPSEVRPDGAKDVFAEPRPVPVTPEDKTRPAYTAAGSTPLGGDQ